MKKNKNSYLIGCIIAFCFLWTSSGYISWLYNLYNIYSTQKTDWLTEVVGYLFQVLGLILFSLYLKKRTNDKTVFMITLVIDYMFMIPAVLASNGIILLISGYGMNLFHGIIAGFYLYYLSKFVPQQKSGLIFGSGYAIGTIGSWLLSLVSSGTFLSNHKVLIVYAILLFVIIGIAFFLPKSKNTILLENSEIDNLTTHHPFFSASFIHTTILIVILLSAVKNTGFYFPTADLASGNVSIEFTRLFYGAGLILAGIINDMSRKYGSLCCLSALIFPFILLFLQQYATYSAIIWIAGYFFFGFFSVYRVVLFSDLSKNKSQYLYLSGFGLLFGRIGDVVGSCIGMLFQNNSIVLVLITSVLFVITVFVFFVWFQKIYVYTLSTQLLQDDSNKTDNSNEMEQDPISHFAKEHNLSTRETDVLKLIFLQKTNNEIAEALFISENTVKFHVKNLMKKTGYTNRKEMLNAIKK